MTHQNVGELAIPQNIEYEKGLLSCVMQRPHLISEVPVQMFWSASHRIIHEAIDRLRKNPKVKELDFAVLRTELSAKGQLEDAGGAIGLNELWGFCPAPSAWAYYRDGLELVRLHREAVLSAIAIQAAADPQGAIEEVEKLKNSKALVRGGLRSIKDVLVDTIDWLETKSERKFLKRLVRFGIPALDDIVLLEPGNEVVICAETGGGKTALAAQAVAQSEEARWAIFSLEMEAEAIAARIIAHTGPVSMRHLMSGRLEGYEVDRTMKAIDNVKERPIWIDATEVTVSQIADACRSLQRAHGLDALVVDYLQLVTPSSRKTDSRQEQVAEISRSLKNLAMELKIVIITMSQLNDEGKVRESRAIAQDADVVMRVTEEAILIQKHRNGPKGKVAAKFIGDLMRFEEIKPSAGE